MSSPILKPRSLLSVARKQLIVTGGAGFVGRNLIAALNERGEENIVLVDRLGRGEKWRNLEGLLFDDLVDTEAFRQRVRDSGIPAGSTVFHFPACEASILGDSDALLDTHYRFSRELGEACLKTGARLIYGSSAATYGAGELGCFDNDTTTARLRPLTAHGFSKHLFDLWALRNGHLAKFAGLKLFDVYGPYESHGTEAHSLVTKLFHEIRDTGEATLFRSHKPDCRDGGQARDFVHVSDAISMILHLFDRPEHAGLFNCGTGKARTHHEAALAVFAAMGREPRISHVDIPEPDRASYQYFTQADMTRARTVGFGQPFASLEDGVRSYVSEHLLPRLAA